MFNMNSPIIQSLLRSQLKKLKKVKIEIRSKKDDSKNTYRIKDHNISVEGAYLTLEEINTGEISYMDVRL